MKCFIVYCFCLDKTLPASSPGTNAVGNRYSISHNLRFYSESREWHSLHKRRGIKTERVLPDHCMVAGGRGREGVLGQNVIYVAGCRAYQMKPTVSVIVRCGVEIGSRCYKSGQFYVNQCSPFLGFLIFGETCYYLYITYHTVFAACTITHPQITSLLQFIQCTKILANIRLSCTNSRSGLDQTNYTLCMVGGTNHTHIINITQSNLPSLPIMQMSKINNTTLSSPHHTHPHQITHILTADDVTDTHGMCWSSLGGRGGGIRNKLYCMYELARAVMCIS